MYDKQAAALNTEPARKIFLSSGNFK